jgi:PST family polysaccharide transporter
MVSYGIVGMLFRAASWSIGYILIAKGDSKLFISTAFGFNALFLLLHVSGYYFFGLKGLGAAFSIHYLLHFLILIIITKKRYEFYFPSDFTGVFMICLLLCVMTLSATIVENAMIKYALFAVLAMLAASYSIYQLNERINLKEIIRTKINRHE